MHTWHPEEIVMLLFVAGGLALLMVVMVLRHGRAVLRHQERLQVIEHGGVLPSLDEERPKAPWSPRVYLLRGMMWLYTGIAITIMIGAMSVSHSRPLDMSDKLARIRDVRNSGATEQQLQQYTRELDAQRNGMPLGAATVGLIPIGVGVAYLMFYRKEKQTPETPRDAS
ncbi:MAG: hypothetical protein ACLQBJ_12545 [Bryobacteraceae bacterium]